jgi:hypothetical protein
MFVGGVFISIIYDFETSLLLEFMKRNIAVSGTSLDASALPRNYLLIPALGR